MVFGILSDPLQNILCRGKGCLGLKTEGIRAVDCDKLPLAWEGGVWFGAQWQESRYLSELDKGKTGQEGMRREMKAY